VRATVLVIALGACYSPSYRDCEVLCTLSQACPSGLACNGVHCVSDLAMACTGDGGPMLADAVTGSWNIPTTVFAPGGTPIDNPTLRGDRLEIFLGNGSNILVARRTTATGNWVTPSNVPELTSSMIEDTPEVSSDGLMLFFVRGDTPGTTEIFEATRALRDLAWNTPTIATALNSPSAETAPAISTDGLTIVFASTRNGNSDLFFANRATTSSPWSPPMPLNALNTPMIEDSPFLSPDKRTIYFSSNRAGSFDLFTATRPTATAEFGAPTPITELNTPSRDETDPWVSDDGRHMFFTRIVSGTHEIVETTR
jgi:hypothetical protein